MYTYKMSDLIMLVQNSQGYIKACVCHLTFHTSVYNPSINDMDGKLLLVIVLSISTTCLCQNEIPVVTLGESGCISTYQDLKASLRNNRTANVNRMLDAFYPPNLTPSHVVFVRYCIKNNYTFDLMDPVAEDFDECYEFQWLANTIPLLIDSDVFLANTFNFASLVQLNLTVSIDPFCEDIDSLQLLETLTVWVSCNY